MSDALEREEREGVLHLALNRPEKLNAINDRMLDLLLEAAEHARTSRGIGAVVLSGRGRAFSAGADIGALEAMDETAFEATIARFMRLALAFQSLPKPIVAAVHGYAMAGGFELAVLCDVRFAAEGTVLGLPDIALGLSPTSGMTWLLPRLVGLGRAMHLTLSGERIDAAEALRIGLVTRVVPAASLLDDAHRLAAQIAASPPAGVAGTKALFINSQAGDLAAATAAEQAGELACFRAPETKQRLRAFLDRRKR